MWDSIVVYGGRYVSNQESICDYKIPQSELKGTQRLNINWLPLVSWQLASDWDPTQGVYTKSGRAGTNSGPFN